MSATVKDTAKKLDIRHIYISKSGSALLNDFDPMKPNQLLSGLFKIDTIGADVKTAIDNETKIEHRILRFFVQAEMIYILGETSEEEMKDNELNKTKQVSEVGATYCVEYAIKSEIELTPDEIKEFGKVNVPYHVWPFWREYVQSTCNRMNLPVTTLPMLIVETVKTLEEQQKV